jgi:NADPH-dependent ferric siderophore reductase
LINPPPEGPTPSGYVYYLPNPKQNGEPVSYDDCEWKTGRIMFEIKGETNAKLLTSRYDALKTSTADKILEQSARQIAASGGRPIVWVFAEKEAAQFVRVLFDKVGRGRQFITVVYIPWTRTNP